MRKLPPLVKTHRGTSPLLRGYLGETSPFETSLQGYIIDNKQKPEFRSEMPYIRFWGILPLDCEHSFAQCVPIALDNGFMG